MAASAPGFTEIPCQNCGKAETFYFCSHYQNLVELNPPGKNPDSFQDRTPSSAILLNMQLISNITNLPGNIAFLWRFCFMYICSLTTSASCCYYPPEYQLFCAHAICAHIKREGICFSGRKKCTLCFQSEPGL